MKCSKCFKDFEEKDIQESHDVPCYLFIGLNRRQSKVIADKFGRHHLCRECHDTYETQLNILLKLKAMEFSKEFFKDGENPKNTAEA